MVLGKKLGESYMRSVAGSSCCLPLSESREKQSEEENSRLRAQFKPLHKAHAAYPCSPLSIRLTLTMITIAPRKEPLRADTSRPRWKQDFIGQQDAVWGKQGWASLLGLSGQASAQKLKMIRLSHHAGPAGVCHPFPPPPLEKMSKKMKCSWDLYSVWTLTLMRKSSLSWV